MPAWCGDIPTRAPSVSSQGDIDEGLAAAAAIGDDRLTKGRVSPDSFTHGTSQQRAQWLSKGLTTGDPNSCNTFRSDDLTRRTQVTRRTS